MKLSRRGLFGSLIGAAAFASPIAAMARTTNFDQGVVTIDYDKIEAWIDDDDLTRDTARFRLKLYQELQHRGKTHVEALNLVKTWFMRTELVRRRGLAKLHFDVNFVELWTETHFRDECETVCRRLGYFKQLEFKLDHELFNKKRGLGLARHREKTLELIREL